MYSQKIILEVKTVAILQLSDIALISIIFILVIALLNTVMELTLP